MCVHIYITEASLSSSNESLIYTNSSPFTMEDTAEALTYTAHEKGPAQNNVSLSLCKLYYSLSTFWSGGQKPSEYSGSSDPKIVSANF